MHFKHTHPDRNTELINIITLGCSKNTVDSEVLMRQLEANQIRFVHNSDSFEAQVVIINTCGFIQDAKEESIHTILQFIQAKEKGLIKKVFVFGCLAQRYRNDLAKEIPEVDQYFGVNDLKKIIDYLGLDYKKDLEIERVVSTPSHYSYLKVSEGCNRKCAFCAIPLIRGELHSKPQDLIMDEAKHLAEKGVKELILIAQDLTSYGLDLYKKNTLADLLRRLSDTGCFEWIRLHYAYPAGFPKEVVSVMKERSNICNYLDLPIQHVNDQVLKMMRRGHSKAQLRDLFALIRAEIPDITLRTTVLTGHPGEGEQEYHELLEFIKEMQFDRLGVFQYSDEEDTYSASHYQDLVPDDIKSMRVEEIMIKQSEISKTLNNNKIEKLFKVLIDERGGEYYTGRTEGDSPEVDQEVLIPISNNKLTVGNFYQIRITNAEEYDLYGIPDNHA